MSLNSNHIADLCGLHVGGDLGPCMHRIGLNCSQCISLEWVQLTSSSTLHPWVLVYGIP